MNTIFIASVVLVLVSSSMGQGIRDDGRCGGGYTTNIGEPAICNPDGQYPCCSSHNWCGTGPAWCDCDGCVDYSIQNNEPECDSGTGLCDCKDNVEGNQCERCKAGYFNLDESDRFGCMACFCYGHSLDCTSASGFELDSIEDDFTRGTQGWSVEYADGSVASPWYNARIRDIAVASDEDSGEAYFVAPDEYLGDKRSSYGRDFSFQLRLGPGDTVLSPRGVILEGDGMTIYAPIVAQDNPRPGRVAKQYVFSLRHERALGWVQNPTAFEFQRVLTNLTGLKIRATYSSRGQGFLDNVRLETVRRSTGPGGILVSSVEQCRCPVGYVGQFCESCATGFCREPPSGGPYALCIPCDDTDECMSDPCVNGVCINGDNGFICDCTTTGFEGTLCENDIFECSSDPCVNGTCIDGINTFLCDCTGTGFEGTLCDVDIFECSSDPCVNGTCIDGINTFFCDCTGTGFEGTLCDVDIFECSSDPCVNGTCIDGINTFFCDCTGTGFEGTLCDVDTDECMSDPCVNGVCINGDNGFICDCTATGFEGTLCENGSQNNETECDSGTGLCDCKDNVEGDQCERCKAGYFNLDESDRFGCMACFCYGHSLDCTSASGFELDSIEDDFTRGTRGWSVEYADGSVASPWYNSRIRDIAVGSDEDSGEAYFVAPDEYLGDKRSSYGRDFSFQLRLGSGDTVLSPRGVILEGDGMTIYAPIVAQDNPQPSRVAKQYVFSLRHERAFGWVQNPTAFEFQRVLTNLTGLKIRATYSSRGQGFLDNVRLETVRRSTGPGGISVSSVEQCLCPDGYMGQFCESCATGFCREPPSGGPYALCIPCDGCPLGWSEFEGHCYFLLTTRVDFETAARQCREQGPSVNGNQIAYLADIASQAENDFIEEITKGYRAWIGLERSRTDETALIWMGENGPNARPFNRGSDYDGFLKNEPNNKNGEERCCEMNRGKPGKWNDVPCRRKLRGVCKYRLSSLQ